MTLPELAAVVSEALEAADIIATLSGGAAVSIYTEYRYLSEDLDFVTIALSASRTQGVLECRYLSTQRPSGTSNFHQHRLVSVERTSIQAIVLY